MFKLINHNLNSYKFLTIPKRQYKILSPDECFVKRYVFVWIKNFVLSLRFWIISVKNGFSFRIFHSSDHSSGWFMKSWFLMESRSDCGMQIAFKYGWINNKKKEAHEDYYATNPNPLNWKLLKFVWSRVKIIYLNHTSFQLLRILIQNQAYL